MGFAIDLGGKMVFSESLKKNYDFQYVYRNGKSYANKYLVMYVLKNNTQRNRLGISAGFLTLVNRIIWQKPHNCGFFYVKFIKF